MRHLMDAFANGFNDDDDDDDGANAAALVPPPLVLVPLSPPSWDRS